MRNILIVFISLTAIALSTLCIVDNCSAGKCNLNRNVYSFSTTTYDDVEITASVEYYANPNERLVISPYIVSNTLSIIKKSTVKELIEYKNSLKQTIITNITNDVLNKYNTSNFRIIDFKLSI